MVIRANTRCDRVNAFLTSDLRRACAVNSVNVKSCACGDISDSVAFYMSSPFAMRCLAVDTQSTGSAVAVFPRRSPIRVLTAVDVA
jgi:hypothetical protein